MKIEVTIIKLDSNTYRIDLTKDTCLATSWKGFKKPTLIFNELNKKTLFFGATVFYENIEDAEFVAREYLKSRNVKQIKKIKA